MITRSLGHQRPYALPQISVFAFSALLLAAAPAAADDSASLTIRNHRFEPSTISVKAGTKIKLTVHNAQSEAAEFESSELNREKVVPPGSSVTVYVGPLEPGSYGFFDDFHQATTGQIVAK
jgi:plastocyanin